MGRIAFIHVPKTGGKSVRLAIEKMGVKVLYHEYVHVENRDRNKWRSRIDNYKILVCGLRDPMERVISAFFYLNQGGTNKQDKARVGKFGFDKMDFETFLDDGGLEWAAENFLHFVPQTFWLRNRKGHLPIEKLRPIWYGQNLQKQFSHVFKGLGLRTPRLGHANRSHHKGVSVPDRHKGTVRRIYADDYRLIDALAGDGRLAADR